MKENWKDKLFYKALMCFIPGAIAYEVTRKLLRGTEVKIASLAGLTAIVFTYYFLERIKLFED